MKTAVIAGGVALALLASFACDAGAHQRIDTTALARDSAGLHLRLAIAGALGDPRLVPAHAAIAFWNGEFERLGRHVRFDSAFLTAVHVPDSLLRQASGEAVRGGGAATTALRTMLRDVPADIVIALSTTDLISFSARWEKGELGIVGVRRSDIPPLTLPNTVQNVIAHELGHVLGLPHNEDPKTLMCGRPAPCRPAAFASEQPHFFPLTADDEALIRHRWP